MLDRRTLLQLLALGSAAGLLPGARAVRADRRIPWRNWSGSQSCVPQARIAPASVEELQEAVAAATGTVRPVGAGHSFSPLVPTDGTILSLARISGLEEHDPAKLQASFMAGTRLSDMGEPLAEMGQALINMPDIDEQILGGAMATCTHGTGASLGALPTYIADLELVTASGDKLYCSPASNPEIFEAARVSLGSLGVITRMTLQNTERYRLRRQSWFLGWQETLSEAEKLAGQHRNFEFYYVPFSGSCLLHSHDLSTEEVQVVPRGDDNEAVEDLKTVRDYLGWSDTLRSLPIEWMVATQPTEVEVQESWLSYASERNVRFNEMEYHLPRENGLAALAEIRNILERDHKQVFFPIEVRFVKGDDVWLSPFHGRDSMSIAVHRFFEEDYRPFFTAIEPIFHKYGGRPHWGKLNTLTGRDFAKLYSRWAEFAELRRQLDPQGKFLNPYLGSLFGSRG